MRWYCSVHSEAVLACSLAKVCIYQHFMILWSLPKALNQGLGVVIPSTLLMQQRAHLQPNGISRQMGRGGRFCRKANQEGTVWCSLTGCKACGLVYCLFKLLVLEVRKGEERGELAKSPGWCAEFGGCKSNLPKVGLKKRDMQQWKISQGQHKQMLPESHANTFDLLGTFHRAALFHTGTAFCHYSVWLQSSNAGSCTESRADVITPVLSKIVNMTLHEHRDAPIQEVYCHMTFWGKTNCALSSPKQS